MTTNSITLTKLSLPQCPYTLCRRACALSLRLRLHTPPAAYHHTDHVHGSSFLGYRSWRRPNGFMRSSSGSSSVSRRRSLSASHSGCASTESSGSNCRPSPLPLLDAASLGRVSSRNVSIYFRRSTSPFTSSRTRSSMVPISEDVSALRIFGFC